MPRVGGFVCAVVVVIGLTASTGAANLQSAGIARGPLLTGIVDSFGREEAPIMFRQVRTAGGSIARFGLYWANVAPPGARPAGFNAADPADPNYRWSSLDREVQLAVAAGLEPIVSVENPPTWARLGDGRPDAEALGAFATAAATRYGGSFGGLPRVRYWQVWNEPNLSVFLSPQFEGSDAVSPEIYREMTNVFARAVHGVHADNVVIAGGQAPFGKPITRRVTYVGVSPLRFMREMLCMTGRTNPRPSCSQRAEFDIWTHHPYTAGGPTKQANNPDDVSLGDLPEMRRLLEAAIAAHHVVSRQSVRFWVTEFSWDSNPPDPKGVPARLHARWVAEAMYRMWKSGVSLVTWFLVRDEPLASSRNQSGLYFNSGGSYANDRPKLALTAFRFPVVAFPSGARILVWGRTPAGVPGTVTVEQQRAGSWFRLASLRANRYGIFTARLRGLSKRGSLRARFRSSTSLPFSLVKPPDFRLQTPFGD
jgi:hypothetical protein